MLKFIRHIADKTTTLKDIKMNIRAFIALEYYQDKIESDLIKPEYYDELYKRYKNNNYE